jgi:hypothetical protein
LPKLIQEQVSPPARERKQEILKTMIPTSWRS